MLILAASMITGMSFAKFSTTVSGSDAITVAKPVLELERSSFTASTDIYKAGSYLFLIKNYDTTNQNETAMQYEIVASSNEEYSGTVLFKLYRSDSAFSSKNEISGSGNSFTDAQMTLGIAENITHYYILEYYPDTAGVVTITVDVVAAQIVEG